MEEIPTREEVLASTFFINDFSPHRCSTPVHPVRGFEQLESSKHSDFQQQESGNCWGAISLGAEG
jgi:hypothetical protein